jgi:hypothetical protein
MIGVLLGRLEDLVNLKVRALAGRADLRDASLKTTAAGLGGGAVWYPIDLPEGYHTASRGQRQTMHAPVRSRVAPGMPCGRAAPDRRDATRTPARRSNSWAVTGPSDVEKY